ncbi:UvrD-helicase domain-containing protein [Cryptobacterium curtum]|uniref:UvrD-helicase domain-containing protein n=1 Tax=Cryptobacterium curtum TaxID=84163 RepID=UPI0028D14B51|nr:UvrD-helicase domain-containing protein [Cryptobacterium curtum]
MDLSRLRPGQLASIKHLDGPLLICAGAGSGKTFTLTQRITWALLPGSGTDGSSFLNNIDEALVITFTNKAAGEIKDRIRAALRAEGMMTEALKVDGAWISTIHGMCSRILREHALEAGLDPAFELAMGANCQMARTEACARVLEEVKETDDNSYQALFAGFRTTQALEDAIGRLLDEVSYQTDGFASLDRGPDPAQASDVVRKVLATCETTIACGTDKNRATAQALADALNDLIAKNHVTPETLLDALNAVDSNGLRGGKAIKLKDAVSEAKALLQLSSASEMLDELVDLAQRTEEKYRAILRARAQLDTSDLIRTTLRLFKQNPGLARTYTERFKLIMVDEFQDTSQLQIDLIEFITGAAKHNLCTVGDSQQSIYRFQGADVEVYLRHKRDMLSDAVGAHIEQLDDNFRSHADVLALVRRICGQKGYFSEEFLDLKAAGTGKTWLNSGPRIEMALTRCTSAEAGARCEAAHIARRFAALRQAGHKARDMVVLMGSTTASDIYAQALRDEGLPCIVAGGSKFFEAPWVDLCQRLVNVLANPYDSESLLMVLTSELLPVSSDDLLFLATYRNEVTGDAVRQNPAAGLLRADRAPFIASELLDHATDVLKRAWESLGSQRPRDVFMQVILESGWLARLEKQGAEGQAIAADILKFARLIEEESYANGFDMARVARALEHRRELSSEKPGALTIEGSDAVRIMTVHASKGLEFPIVAIANCYTTRTTGEKPYMLTDQGKIALTLPPSDLKAPKLPEELADVTTPFEATNQLEFLQLIRKIDTDREYAERKRLFYVAATRASDAVIVCLKHKLKKDGSPQEYKQVERDLLNGLFLGKADFPLESGTFEYGGSEPGVFTCLTAAEDDATGAQVASEQTDAQADIQADTRTDTQAGMQAGTQTGTDSHADTNAQPDTTIHTEANARISVGASLSAHADEAALPSDDSFEHHRIALPELESKTALVTYPLDDRSDFFSYTSLAAGATHAQTDEATSGVTISDVANTNMVSAAATPTETDPADVTPAETVSAYIADAKNEQLPDSIATEHHQVEDDATAFGSAVHQTCEWLALQPVLPSSDELAAAIKRFSLLWHVSDVPRVHTAVSNWLNSSLCKQAFSFPQHSPEVPFTILVGDEMLEGEIDLLCTGTHPRKTKGHATSADDCAFIVDYKTGGSSLETPEQLSAKHLLQAQCYAYAALQNGFSHVEAHFIRLEQYTDSGEPQTVSYSFNRSNLSELECLILAARKAAQRAITQTIAAQQD